MDQGHAHPDRTVARQQHDFEESSQRPEPGGSRGGAPRAITAAENHALTLVEETHYQLITTGIERVREHVKEELDENGNVIKRVREITKETVIDRGGMQWYMERRDPERWPTVRMIEHSGAIDTSRARPVEVVVRGLKRWVDEEEADGREDGQQQPES